MTNQRQALHFLHQIVRIGDAPMTGNHLRGDVASIFNRDLVAVGVDRPLSLGLLK